MKNILYMVYFLLSEISDFSKQSSCDYLKIRAFFHLYFFNNLILINIIFNSLYN